MLTGPARAQETVTTLDNISLSTTTGEKPQSKLWQHAGTWWAVLPSSGVRPSGTWLWRLDEKKWRNVLRLSTRTDTKADACAVGDLTHVLLHGGSTTLASLEYVPSQATYRLWSARPTLTAVSLPGAEAATIDVDSTGRMWLATDSGSDIIVRYSDPPYTTFSAGLVIEDDVHSDDIADVIALPDRTVGVFWSNQRTSLFGFRLHIDGMDPTLWLPDETPAADSALDIGDGFADDHMHLAATADGTIFASVKTSYNVSRQPQIALLVRHPGGQWDDIHPVDYPGTRPIVVVNEAVGTLRVFYTSETGGGNVVFKETPLDPIKFGPRRTLLSGNLNDATSTKDSWTDDLVVMAAGRSARIRRLTTTTTTRTTTTRTSTTRTSTSTTRTTTTSTTTTRTTTTTSPTTSTSGGDDTTSTTSTTLPTVEPVVRLEADTFVRAKNPNSNFGSSAALQVDGSPRKVTLLRFGVQGLTGRTLSSARLQLWVTNVAGAGSRSPGRVHRTTCDWSETAITWRTRPILEAPLSAPAGPVRRGALVEFDVTTALDAGDGAYCFGIDTTVSNGVDYTSRDAARAAAPNLVLTVAP